MANDRVAQLPVEVLETSTDLKGRVAQVAVEVLVTSTSLKGRTAQAPVEVLVAPTDANVSATQVAVEAVAQDQNPSVSATRVAIEVVRSSVTTYSSSFTANAHILATVTVQDSISADAVKLQASTGSVDAHSIVLRQISDAITAHAAVLRPYSYSFTASAEKTSTRYGLFYLDAVISVEWGPWTPPESNPVTQQFTLDARYVIRGEGSLTADAYIIRRISGSVAADAIKLRSTSGSVTARATIWKSTSGSITANASIVQRYYGSASADAWIRRTYQKSFTANAAVLKTTASGFSADAVIIYERHYGSFESDALVLRTYEKSFTSNAAVLKTTEGSVTSEAYIIVGRVYGSFTADAVLLRTVRSNWDELVTAYGQPLLWYRMSEASGTFYDSGSTGAHLDSKSAFGVNYQQHGYVDASAEFNGLAYTRTSLTNYVVAVGNNLTMEAWVYPTSATRMTILGCNNVEQVIQLEISATQQVSAIENGTFIATSTAGDVTLNAWNHIVYTRSGTSTFTNKIYVNGTQRTLTANNTTLAFLDDPAPRYVGARTTSTQRWAGYIDEVVVYPRVMGLNEVVAHYGFRVAFEARAVLLATTSKSFTSSAAIKKTGNLGEFTADARFCGGGWLPTNAVILGTRTGSFSASAVSLDTFGGTFTADAKFCGGGWLSADAAIFGGRTGSFTAKARISIAAFGSFTLDARINPKITADAILLKPTESSITADADITSYARRVKSFTANSHITGPVTRSVSVDALIRATNSGSFTADAVLMPRITADAVISKTQVSSFSAAAWIYVPRTEPPGPNQTPLVQILIEYESNWLDITDDVILSQAMFTMSVNGAPGQFSLTVRDSGHDYNFVSGAEITVDVDGRRKFGGYVTMVSRQFAFPVDDTTDEDTVDRLWVLTGSDYNILFNTRVLYDKDNPSNVALREWPKGTQDDVIIRYIIDNYTDLAADGVTTDRVKHVGHPNPDRRGVVGSGGLLVGDAMREVNRLIGAVWYLDQWKVLHYVDVDVQSNPLGLSDHPGANQVGYRELEHNSNGTSLFNDALVWGTGKGSDDLTFSREQDSTSQDTHGRWQYGEFTSTLYKQASVNLRASTVVNGVPQSGRGAKNDKVSWTVTTYEMSFQVGQVVEIESEAFGLAPTNVPIRRWTMTFPTKRDPQFQLLLSHEIDEPWNMYEFYFPRFSFNYRAPNIDKIKIEKPCPSGNPTCNESLCGITDSFGRTVSNSWGTSDSGLTYALVGGAAPPPPVLVDGSRGVLSSDSYSYWTGQELNNIFDGYDGDYQFTITMQCNHSLVSGTLEEPLGTDVGEYISFSDGGGTPWIELGTASGVPYVLIDSNDYLSYLNGLDYSSLFMLKGFWELTSLTLYVKVWQVGSTEPESWSISKQYAVAQSMLDWRITVSKRVAAGSQLQVWFDDLEIPGYTRCAASAHFDDFSREELSGWDAASSGGGNWDIATYPTWGTVIQKVTAGYGELQCAWATMGGLSLQLPTTVRVHHTLTETLMQSIDGEYDLYNPTTTQYAYITPELNSDTGNFRISWYANAPDLTYGSGDIPDITTMPLTNGNVTIEWIVETARMGFRAWNDGSAIPDFYYVDYIDYNLEPFTLADAFTEFGLGPYRSTGVDGHWKIDYIDIGTQSAACIPDKPFVIDDFSNRTIALNYHSSMWSESTGLGETSGTGTTWIVGTGNGGANDLYTAEDNTVWGVQDGTLVVQMGYNPSCTIVGLVDDRFDWQSDFMPWYTYGLGTPDELFNSSRVSFDFWSDSYTTYNPSHTQAYIQTWWGNQWGDGISVELYRNSGVGPIDMMTCWSSTSSGYGEGPISLETSTWYTLEYLVLGGKGEVRLWKRDSEPRPESPTRTTTIAPPPPWTGYAYGGSWYGFVGREFTIMPILEYATFKIDNIVAYEVGTDGSGSGTNCSGMSNDVATAGQKVFTLPEAFIPDSTRVWVDGLFQRPGYAYEENPPAGKVTFYTALSGGELVHIEYVSDEDT